ncbi:MAG TPA: hypothetical protein VIC87_08695 [Vicinamibacteria bacterium]
MPRPGRAWSALVLLLAPLAAAAAATAKKPAALPSAAGIAVAKLTYVDRVVERESIPNPEGGWRPLKEGDAVRTGDRLRTSPEAVARIQFPWMSVTAGPSTTLHIPASMILSTVLDEGRAEFEAGDREIMKVRTAEAEIRGAGRIVVRRSREKTLVMAMALGGTFRVEAKGDVTVLRQGEGTFVRDGKPPAPPVKIPDPPKVLHPGADPVYVRKGEPVVLKFAPSGPAYVQILPMHGPEVLIARDVASSPATLGIPWEGTYRWRVSSRNDQGFEGLPSEDGVVCVVDR